LNTRAFATCFLLSAITAFAHDLRILYNFPTNSYPQSTLVFGSDGALYGTTQMGGDFGYGSVFRITTQGDFTNLFSFHRSDGAYPYSGLLKAGDDAFYGTAQNGGAQGWGTVFRITTNGALTTLCDFANTNGAYPKGVLIRGRDGALYGTTYGGGSMGYGSVFRITTEGMLTTLVSLANTNGAGPFGGMIQGQDGAFYGSTTYGGDVGFASGYGTIFCVTSGGELTNLYIFHGFGSSNPIGELLQTGDGLLYGVAGSIFQITTNGTFKILDDNPSFPQPMCRSGLMQGADGALYGTAWDTAYRITANGVVTDLAVFYNFWNGSDPRAGLVQDQDTALYGTTAQGGLFGGGTVFRIDLTSYFYPLTRATNGWQVLFAGLAGNTYRVLRSSSAAGPWVTATNVVTDGYGLGRWVDPEPGLDRAFYLLVLP